MTQDQYVIRRKTSLIQGYVFSVYEQGNWYVIQSLQLLLFHIIVIVFLESDSSKRCVPLILLA